MGGGHAPLFGRGAPGAAVVVGILPAGEGLALLARGGQDRDFAIDIRVPAVGQHPGEFSLTEVVGIAGSRIDSGVRRDECDGAVVTLIHGSGDLGVRREIVVAAGYGGSPQFLVRILGAPSGAPVSRTAADDVGASPNPGLTPGDAGRLAVIGVDELVVGDDEAAPVTAPVDIGGGVGVGIEFRGPLLLRIIAGDVVGGHSRDILVRIGVGDEELVLVPEEDRLPTGVHRPGLTGALRPGCGGHCDDRIGGLEEEPYSRRGGAQDEDGDEYDDDDDDRSGGPGPFEGRSAPDAWGGGEGEGRRRRLGDRALDEGDLDGGVKGDPQPVDQFRIGGGVGGQDGMQVGPGGGDTGQLGGRGGGGAGGQKIRVGRARARRD